MVVERKKRALTRQDEMQLAFRAEKEWTSGPGGRGPRGPTRVEVAEKYGIHPNTVEDVRRILHKKPVDELIAAVRAAEISIGKARQIADLHKEDQLTALTRVRRRTRPAERFARYVRAPAPYKERIPIAMRMLESAVETLVNCEAELNGDCAQRLRKARLHMSRIIKICERKESTNG